MYEKISSKNLFFFSLGIAEYFMFLCLNTYLIKSEHLLVGIMQETCTIPMLVIQLFLLFLSLNYCIKDKFRIMKYSFWAFLISIISNLLTLGSIIIVQLNS